MKNKKRRHKPLLKEDKPIKHILYQLSKATDLFNFAAGNHLDQWMIAEEFFTNEAPEIIKELERMCGYNGNPSNRTASA